MKYLKIIAAVFFTVFSIACQTQSKEIENITVTDLKTLLSNGDNIQLVDVRTPKEWEGGIIQNAEKIDVTATDFEARVLHTLNKEKPVYLYCRSGGRSLIAAETLVKNGFKVYNVEGGYTEWKQKK
ncbi:rhodanese-like domain-containing protein [Tenacibaculum sp. 190524A02b]|uniref:rhodanese-like domain-containing protein n=1 Tax=Tenacibaculum vairaonense TaxID=3137860 RepID=UPI0031FA84F7